MLPETFEKQLEELIEQYKREQRTTFVSRIERQAIERGLLQGIEQGI